MVFYLTLLIYNNEQLHISKHVKEKLTTAQGNLSSNILSKFVKVTRNNKGLQTLERIDRAISGDGIMPDNKYTVMETSSLKYAPITSVGVERSFSMYNALLRPNRESFNVENLTQLFFIYCNSNINMHA